MLEDRSLLIELTRLLDVERMSCSQDCGDERGSSMLADGDLPARAMACFSV
jgi:hypothetical protein